MNTTFIARVYGPIGRLLLLFAWIAAMSGCREPVSPPVRPRQVVLMIGDGMGLAQVSSLYFNPAVTAVHFDRFTHVGLIRTEPADGKVTDSAAAGTSFASGVKTYNAAIGVDVDTARVETIVERASRAGALTGLVATSSIVHATPAAFYAHVASRNQYEDIAAFLPISEVDFFAGGGTQFFAGRKDGRDVFGELVKAGFAMDTVALAPAGRLHPPQRYGFLLARDAMPRMLDGRGTFLSDATSRALEYLAQGERGFFLMVEGSQIDWGGHANDVEYLYSEMADFNEAVGVVLDFAARDRQTLVVVTADHETGGLSLSSGEGYDVVVPTFSTGGHSATLIPVFAFGPGAESFQGVHENTVVFDRLISAFGW